MKEEAGKLKEGAGKFKDHMIEKFPLRNLISLINFNKKISLRLKKMLRSYENLLKNIIFDPL